MTLTCTECVVDGYRTQSFSGSLTAVNNAELVSAARALAGIKYEVVYARIVQDATAVIVLSSGGVDICPVANDVGEIECVLIEGTDLQVDVTGTGDGSYTVTIKWL